MEINADHNDKNKTDDHRYMIIGDTASAALTTQQHK